MKNAKHTLLKRTVFVRLILAALTFGLILPATTPKVNAQGTVDDYVQLTVTNGQFWVTCKRPIPGAGLLSVTVVARVLRGAGYLGSGMQNITFTVPLSNILGAESEARSDSFGTIYSGYIKTVTPLR